MTVLKATLQAMQEILGLEEMENEIDLNLWDSGLVDSLGVVTLIDRIEELIGSSISIKLMKTQDFISIRKMVAAISTQTGKA